jgi:hypothetical protein
MFTNLPTPSYSENSQVQISLQRPTTLTEILHVSFDVFMAKTVKNAVFWELTPRGSCKN